MPVVSLKIGGNDKQDKREGYNKIEVNTNNYTVNGITVTNNGDGSLTLNGTNTNKVTYIQINATGATIKNNYFNLVNGKNYYLYAGAVMNGNMGLYIRSDSNISYSLSVSGNEIGKVITWNSQTYENGFAFLRIGENVVLNNLTIRPMLAESDVELEYEAYGAMPSPEYPSKIETVNTQANIIICNKNFLKITSDTRENTRNGVKIIIDDDGLITLNGTATAMFWPDLLWGIHNNTVNHDVCKYKISHINKATFSFKHVSGTINQNNMFITAAFNDNSDLRVSLTAGSTTTNKVVDGDIYGINRAYLTINEGMVFDNYKFYLQVEEGETETDFAVPEQQIKTVDIQQPMLFGDYFVKEKDGWKEVHLKDKEIFDGTEEGWNTSATDTSGINRFSNSLLSTIIKKVSNSNEIADLKSDKFIAVSANQTYSKTEGISINASGTIYIFYNACSSMDKIEFINWLSANPFYIWYKLATPTKLVCTEKQSAQLDDLLNTSTYKNVTHIYSTDKVSPVIKVVYRKDTPTLLNNIYKLIIENGGI